MRNRATAGTLGRGPGFLRNRTNFGRAGVAACFCENERISSLGLGRCDFAEQSQFGRVTLRGFAEQSHGEDIGAGAWLFCETKPIWAGWCCGAILRNRTNFELGVWERRFYRAKPILASDVAGFCRTEPRWRHWGGRVVCETMPILGGLVSRGDVAKQNEFRA